MAENKIVKRVVELLEDKKGFNVEVINVGKVTIVADYFILCSGTSTTHVKSLADEVEAKLIEEFDLTSHHIEGYNGAGWILMDYGDFIVHIFLQSEREFYNLERLWQDGIYEYRNSNDSENDSE